MGKKILILASVILCVALFLMELSRLENTKNDLYDISQVKQTFQDEIQELKDGKYENFVATDFDASIDEVEQVYHLQILYPEEYVNQSLLEDYTLVIKGGDLENLGTSNYRNQKLQNGLTEVNGVIDKFFQAEVEKSFLRVDYWTEEDCIQIAYEEFLSEVADGLTTNRNVFYLFGNNIKDGGRMIQIGSNINGAWFSRGELGDIMPSLNKCKESYLYLAGKRQVEDAVLHLIDGDIQLSVLEQRVLEYMNTEEFPLQKIDGISYEIGQVFVIENEKHTDYDGVSFIVRREYKGVPFECGLWSAYYDYDTSEISYARSDVPDTLRGFYGLKGSVLEVQSVRTMLSVGEALQKLSEYFGTSNGSYEIRGIELVYKNVDVPEEDQSKISDILEPKWKFIVCPGGSGNELRYYVDVETGEIG